MVSAVAIEHKIKASPKSSAGPLQAGDILIKYSDGGAVSKGIWAGQMLSASREYADWVHAGIATSHNKIAEMDGEGLQSHCLATKNAHYKYRVFRTAHRGVANGASETANMLLGFQGSKKGRINYSKSKAAFSVTWSRHPIKNTNRVNLFLDDLLCGKDVNLFCSEFVVVCYAVSLEQNSLLPMRLKDNSLPVMSDFFHYEPLEYSPAYMHKMLSEGRSLFTYLGEYSGMKWL